MTFEYPLWIHAVFLLFVAIAVYAHTVTGFAQSLILLGLIGATGLFPLPDAVNAATVQGLFNAWTFAYLRRPVRLEPALRPMLAGSAIGIVAGVAIMAWIAGASYQLLRLLLGISVIVCAGLLWFAARPLPRLSPPSAFAAAGGISGIMTGLFSTPGPPLVYLLYRQPMELSRIQESLVLIFGIGAILRLLIVVPTGQFSMVALQLALESMPVVVLVTFLTVRYPPSLPRPVLKSIVCVLLVMTGVGMVGGAVTALR